MSGVAATEDATNQLTTRLSREESVEKFHWDCSAVPPQKRFAKTACGDHPGLKSSPSLLQTAAELPGLRVLDSSFPP